MAWKYCFPDLGSEPQEIYPPDFVGMLEDFSADGWELVQLIGTRAVFRAPVEEEGSPIEGISTEEYALGRAYLLGKIDPADFESQNRARAILGRSLEAKSNKSAENRTKAERRLMLAGLSTRLDDAVNRKDQRTAAAYALVISLLEQEE